MSRFWPGHWTARLGIRTHLLLLVLALGLPFLAYLVLSAARQSVIEREHAGTQMLAIAQVTAARLDDHIGNMHQMLATLSQVLGPGAADTEGNDTLLRRMRTHLPELVNNVTVWTRAGDNIGSFDTRLRTQPFSIADRRYFQAALKAKGLTIEAPVVSRSNREQVAIFAVPLLDAGEVAGVVAASTRLAPLKTLLDPAGSLPAGAVITVIDASGVVIARSVDPDQWIGRPMPGGRRDAIRNRFEQGAGTFESHDFNGVDRVFGFSATKGAPWLVYVGIPSTVALAPVKARLYKNLALGVAMLSIGLLLAAWVAERISRPLRQLSADAAALGRGELEHRSRVTTAGEIGLLAATLNHMAEALHERTASLQRSEAGLRQITGNLPALICHLDLEQRFRFANFGYRDWLGLEPDSLVGRSLREVFGEAAYADLRPHVEAALAGARTVYEREINTLQGPRYVHVTGVPQRDAHDVVQGVYVMIHDITERREAELRRARSEERLSLALEGSDLGLFDWDIRARRIHYSAQASVMRGGAAEDGTTTPQAVLALVHPDDRDAVQAQLRATLKGSAAMYNVEYRVRKGMDDWVWIRSKGRVVERDASGRALRLAGTDADISERKATEQRLRQLAEYDALTGLPNRALFHDRLRQALVRAARSKKPIALLFMDVDHFKQINDTLGHEAGDELLKLFAQRLTAVLRKSDTVARLAGDEFTAILEEQHELADARSVAHKLVEAVRSPMALPGRVVEVTASIGVALSVADETDGAALIRRADAALYEAKRRGRNGYWCFADVGATHGA